MNKTKTILDGIFKNKTKDRPPVAISKIRFQDIVYAYKKAKTDAFYERSQVTSDQFAAYERTGISASLENLFNRIRENGFKEIDKIALASIEDVHLVPKGYEITPKPGIGHGFISDPNKSFKIQISSGSANVSFRLVPRLSVEYRIISALWVNWVGHYYDKSLSECSYGARLSRLGGKRGNYHIESIGSFKKYIYDYKRWRDDGLSAVKNELKNGNSVVGITLDFKSFYHNIDPAVIQQMELLTDNSPFGFEASVDEKRRVVGNRLSESIFIAYRKFNKVSKEKFNLDESHPIGIPLGDSTGRIVANCLLYRWDRAIENNVCPIFYGRYIDDVFIVLRDTEQYQSCTGLLQRLKLDFLKEPGGVILDIVGDNCQINLGKIKGKEIQLGSKISIQSSKSKAFFLSGNTGLDMLEGIEKEIIDISSERRMMAGVDFLDKSPGAQALAVTGSLQQESDTFGRTEKVSIRRLGWSILLNKAESLCHIYERGLWTKCRSEFYRFAVDHVFSPKSVFEHFISVKRIIGLAVEQKDWSDLFRVILAFKNSIELIVTAGQNVKFTFNGSEVVNGNGPLYAKMVMDFVDLVIFDSVAASWPIVDGIPLRLDEVFQRRLLKMVNIDSIDDFNEYVISYAMSDLSRIPYKDLLNKNFYLKKKASDPDVNALREKWGYGFKSEWLLDFMRSTAKARRAPVGKESPIPFIFPTRPFGPRDLVLLAPECCLYPDMEEKSDHYGASLDRLRRWTHVLKGIWIKSSRSGATEEISKINKDARDLNIIIVGNEMPEKIRIALGFLRVGESEWNATASARGNATIERQAALAEIYNQLAKMSWKERPQYLVMPELSIPEKWSLLYANRLSCIGVNLIAGIEYKHLENNSVTNEVLLSLNDSRLGSPFPVQIFHRKSSPSTSEGKSLFELYGKTMCGRNYRDDFDFKNVYIHNGFSFSLLICSEMLNVQHFGRYRGMIDALFVPSWNQDLKTFSPIIEAASYLIHSNIVYANNGMYGDARIRAPYSKDYRRDICRIVGGLNPHVIVSEIDIHSLRKFQSRFQTSTDGEWKAVPDGFDIAPWRRKLP